VGNVVRMREMRNAYRILVGKPEGKMTWSRHRWDDIKMVHKAIGYDGAGWVSVLG